MSKTPHIVVMCPNKTDATAFYRASWPLARLAREGLITYEFMDKQDDAILMRCDLIFLQRPNSTEHKTLAKSAKIWGKMVWVDYDDDLFNVPETNPAFHFFSNKNVRENMEACLKEADLVTVSTGFLKSQLEKYSSNIVVVPNAIDLKLLDYRNINEKARKKLIAWRGGNTHEDDVATVVNELIETSKQKPEWKFVFFGHKFPMFKNLLSKDSYIQAGSLPFLLYMENLHRTQAPIHITPLEFNDFNRAKSNIAWLEASWAGSAVIAPDMEEWQHPGVVRYNTPKQFKEALLTLINDPGLMLKCQKASWDYILDNLTLEIVNKQRYELIKNIAKLSK